LEQVRKQLQKLVPVVKVVDYKTATFVERDLMLVQVSTSDEDGPASKREELITLANLFRAHCVDVSPDRLMIELSGTEDKIEAFIDLIQPFGIVELARTGVIAMPRGGSSTTRNHQAAKSEAARQIDDTEPTVNLGDLPPS